jgi:hypothetical protein
MFIARSRFPGIAGELFKRPPLAYASQAVHTLLLWTSRLPASVLRAGEAGLSQDALPFPFEAG